MRKILIFIALVLLSLIVYFGYKPTKNIGIPINEYKTFPPKEYLEDLEKHKFQ